MKILLTGTPFANGRPDDIVNLLITLGGWDLVREVAVLGGATPQKSTMAMFRSAFMRMERPGGTRRDGRPFPPKWTGDTVKAPALQRALRATVMVRREKELVLRDLPPLNQQVIGLDLNGQLDEYTRVETSFRNWLLERGGQDALNSAMRAEVLVQINHLRRLAGEAKAQSAVEWALEWLDDHENESLVIFADGRNTQVRIFEALLLAGHKVAHADAGSKMDQLQPAFQAGEVRVLVCSLRAIKEGVSLTRSSTVLMVEQGWTATMTDQALARCHRIGSEAHSSVDAIFLLAVGTFDETVFALVNSKRTISDLASKGEFLEGEMDEADTTVVDAIINYVLNK